MAEAAPSKAGVSPFGKGFVTDAWYFVALGRDVAAASLKRYEIMGEPVRPKGVPLYTDARLYAAAGVPVALYGAGPRTIEEANAHRADERLPLSDLYKATEVVTLTLIDLLTGQ